MNEDEERLSWPGHIVDKHINKQKEAMSDRKFYRKKPLVQMTQWFKDGDHEAVVDYKGVFFDNNGSCRYCDKHCICHGWVQTLEGGHIVCPGDWIITGANGEHYPCKPDVKEASYEEAVEDVTKTRSYQKQSGQNLTCEVMAIVDGWAMVKVGGMDMPQVFPEERLDDMMDQII